MRRLIALSLLATSLYAQPSQSSARRIISGTTLPSTCNVGDVFFKSNATAGQNIYECASLNTWTQESSGGGGISGLTPGTLPKAATSSTINDSSVTQDGTTGQITSGKGLNV